MGTGYTRNDTGNNIADGNVINASDLDGEYNAIEAAFNESTGHSHDGTSAEGAPITVVGPVQDVEISATAVNPKSASAGNIDLGASGAQFKDLYIDGLAYIDGLGENLLVNSTNEIQFRDSALKINSSADGQLDIDADTELELTAPTVDINASTSVNISNDLKLDSDSAILSLGADGEVTLTHLHNVGTELKVVNSTTSSVTDILDLQVESSSTPVVGIGTGLTFSVETASGNVETAGAIRAVATGLTPTDEELDLVFYSMRNGSLTEGFRYDSSADTLDVTGTVTATAIEDTPIGGSTPAAGSFTTGQFDTSLNVDGTVTADALTVDGDGKFTGAFPRLSLIENDTTDSNTTFTNAGSDFKIYTSNDALSSFTTRFEINHTTGDISFYEDTGTTPKLFWDASAESLGIGTSSPTDKIHLVGSSGYTGMRVVDGTDIGIMQWHVSDGFRLAVVPNKPLVFFTNDTEAMRIDSSGNVGIGTSNPSGVNSGSDDLVIGDASGNRGLTILSGGSSLGLITFNDGVNTTRTGGFEYDHSSNYLAFRTNNDEAMRIDSAGSLLVGTTDNTPGVGDTNVGTAIGGTGTTFISGSGSYILSLNKNADGDIVLFRKDGSTVGSIGAVGSNIYIGSASYFRFTTSDIRPSTSTGANSDNTTDLGDGSSRFDDIYATNGTIQTSDRNEKQDIEELSEAERRVAVAAKGLLRKFRWKDAVAEKGDDARIHFGIIAQDLQAAFEAEGLDAGRYAMFIHSEWWETYTDVPAVEAQDAVYETVTDEDGNETQVLVSEAVEAKEAYTRTDTYDTEEEAPEGAVKKSRMGVRYSELLAFIIAAI